MVGANDGRDSDDLGGGDGQTDGVGGYAAFGDGEGGGVDGDLEGFIVEADDGEVRDLNGGGIASDGMSEGDGIVFPVIVLASTDGDGLGGRPLGGAEEE